ncbi:MAG: glycosyltransferase, partial [Patescibacteria group bacterium]|nr:glycosyltransferase [Patescibacteria group bacterium]
MKDIILLPTYNEKATIAQLIDEIFYFVPSAYIVVVDDNSPDGTAGVVRELMLQRPQLSLINRAKKEGLGAAYKYALSHLALDSNIRSITTMDADGSHQPKYLPEFLKQIEKYDLIVGSRYIRGGGVEGWERWRLLLSQGGNIYSRLLTGLPIRDQTAGFVCFRHQLIKKMDFLKISSAGYAYQIEFKFYCLSTLQASYLEVPIIFN